MVEAAMGTTLQPYLAVCRYIKSSRALVRPISGPTITRRLHLIRSRHRQLTAHENEVYKSMRTHLRRELAEHHPWASLEAVADTV